MPPTISVRPFSWHALQEWTNLYNSAFGIAATERAYDLPSMRQYLSFPGLNPERDCFVARESDADAGLAILRTEPPIRRAVLEIGVSNARSPQTVVQALIHAAAAWANNLPVSVLHVQTTSDDTDKRRILNEVGFRPVRRYSTMRWSENSLPKVRLPDGFTITSFRTGQDSQRLMDIQNAAFRDSWGFSPNTIEQIEAGIASTSTSPEGILFITRGSEVAAYNWTARPAGPGGKLGRIAMTGVHPNYRGMGLSRPTVLAGMTWLTSERVEIIELEMDSSNLSAAKVYESLNFKKIGDTVWFELRLRG